MHKDAIKALVVVEGEKAEKNFFESLSSVFDLSFSIVPFKANIYELHSTKQVNESPKYVNFIFPSI